MIFISDLPDVVMPGNTIALCADDCKTSRVVSCPSDQQEFQSDLDNLCEWSQRNLMDFNVKKCKLLRITKKRMPFHADLKVYLTPKYFFRLNKSLHLFETQCAF